LGLLHVNRYINTQKFLAIYTDIPGSRIATCLMLEGTRAGKWGSLSHGQGVDATVLRQTGPLTNCRDETVLRKPCYVMIRMIVSDARIELDLINREDDWVDAERTTQEEEVVGVRRMKMS